MESCLASFLQIFDFSVSINTMNIEILPPTSISSLLNNIDTTESFVVDDQATCTGLTCDSRDVKPGSIFVAYKGVDADGHKYIESAVKSGATFIVAEDKENIPEGVSSAIVADGRVAYSALSASVCGNPLNDLTTIGVTGTNGKTTTLWLIAKALEELKHSVLQMGTLGIAHGDKMILTGENTTPPCDVIHSSARQAKENGATACVMEVTSHGIHQKRTPHIDFNAVVFTNLSNDHLHYHADMDEYFAVKKELFEQALQNNPKTPCIVGVDDEYGKKLANWCEKKGANLLTFGFDSSATIQVKDVELFSDSIKGTLVDEAAGLDFHSPLIGEFNALNFATAYAVLKALSYDQTEAIEVLSKFAAPSGRMERFDFNNAKIFVDYAHTGDAMRKALQTLRPITDGKLWVMFGAGGSKDPAKRSSMGEAAKELADCAVLTADNPKTVPIADINKDIMSSGLEPSYIIDDRETAIRETLAKLTPGDVLIIAGKGHEDYQFIGSETLDYSDQSAVKKAIAHLSV